MLLTSNEKVFNFFLNITLCYTFDSKHLMEKVPYMYLLNTNKLKQ